LTLEEIERVQIGNLYLGPGYCEAITELYKSEGWDRVFPKELVVDLLTKDLKIYAELVGIHRGNILWYNTKLLEKNGIKVGDQLSFDQFFAACDKLKAAGIPALGVGDSGIWASAQGRAEHRNDEGGDAEEGLRSALLLGWIGIEQDALAAGLESAASETLHDAKKDQLIQTRRHTTEH
jgi:hypothetical protein